MRAVHDLAAALTVGLLAVGTWCIAPERGAPAGELTGTLAGHDSSRWVLRPPSGWTASLIFYCADSGRISQESGSPIRASAGCS